jgi:hypothetical protein
MCFLLHLVAALSEARRIPLWAAVIVSRFIERRWFVGGQVAGRDDLIGPGNLDIGSAFIQAAYGEVTRMRMYCS